MAKRLIGEQDRSFATMTFISEHEHDHAICPCCGHAFACLMDQPTECPCNAVEVTPDEAIDLSFAWSDVCLCPMCLRQERDKLRSMGG